MKGVNEMKRLVSIALVLMLLLGLATTVQAATPSEDLYAYVSKTFTIAGQEVKLLSDADLVKVERYLNENSITEDQYNTIKTQIDKVVAVMDAAGVTDVTKLTGTDEENVKSYVSVAAAALDLTVTYNAKDDSVTILDASGKVIEQTSTTSVHKLTQTGATHYGYVAVPVVAIIAVAIVAAYKKANRA